MSETCECEICKNKLPFAMPKGIIEALTNYNLVLFAGAGISTETKQVFKETLYEEVFLDLKESNENISLMSKYCNNTVNGRQKLLEKIKKRFDYVHQYNELYSEASRFHTEISRFWMLENIITTNWDDYFERESGAIPIVTPKDFVFHNIRQRKVFKIHGSISNYGSIVATKEDYNECYKSLSTGLIGASLKTLLATKTILFVGYSFRDFDFNKVIELLKLEMGDVFPHLYIVTLDTEVPKSLEGFSFTLINTSGTYFFEKIREHLENKNLIMKEEQIDRIYKVKHVLRTAHTKLSVIVKT
ncbi:SIR2 family protein [Flagellimonas onchidii]|uniref:SIR2 family protein n=1 Tax=Flagellimonas onchidii TaxID=2562684 RepID=UPI0010A60B59|nr:SIR2 family protein [Allomuricauda onchidii]